MRGHRVHIAAVSSRLSPADEARLEQILSGKIEYVASPLFYRKDSEKKIFDDAAPIARPDTSWYHPVMQNVGESSMPKNASTVLLTAAQERVLFLQFNYCRYRVWKLKNQLTDRVVTVRLARPMLKWDRMAEAFRDQIAQTNLALVLAMAKRTRMSDVDFCDLVSEGNMALLRAVDKFDVGRGFKFSTYACRAILKAFSRSSIKLSKYRQLFPTDFDPKLEKSNYVQKKRENHEDDCVDEIRRILGSNHAALTDIEQSVIEHRFSLGAQQTRTPDHRPLTLEQVGRIVGVTKERVRQIQNKALGKIRHSLEAEFLG
jgi:RNA polymerase primary sigma factor